MCRTTWAWARFSFLPSLLDWDGAFGRVASENLYATSTMTACRTSPSTPARTNGGGTRPRGRQDRGLPACRNGSAQTHGVCDRHSTATDARLPRKARRWPRWLSAGSSIVRADIADGIDTARATLEGSWRQGVFAVHYLRPRCGMTAGRTKTSSPRLPWGRSRPRARRWSSAGLRGQLVRGLLRSIPGRGAAHDTGCGRGGELRAVRHHVSQGAARLVRTGLQAVGQTGHNTLTLGELIRQSKAAALAKPYSAPVVAGWNLLGDPALSLVTGPGVR